MRIFLSYSFQDSELYVVALLINQLKQKGFTVETSDHFGTGLFSNNSYKINQSDYFIGLITNNSESVNTVIHEWEIARSANKKNILVVETGVRIENPQSINFIYFDRFNPQLAIDRILNPRTSNFVPASSPKKTFEDTITVGAIAIGIAALISMLSGSNKK